MAALLASSSLAALLIGGGARPGLASCIAQSGGTAPAVTNPALGAAFPTLPGANFTVNGPTPPKNSALTTAAAELHIGANWTAIAKFDGAFGAGAQTYGGTGTLKYSW